MSDPIFAANQRVQETFKCFEAAVAVSSELRLDESGAPEARAKESETLGAFFAACEEMTLRRREEKAPPWRTGLDEDATRAWGLLKNVLAQSPIPSTD